MCEPVSITMGVLAVAGAVTSIIGQNTQRQAQKGYQNQLTIANANQMKLNADIADQAYLQQASQNNIGLAESREAAAVSNEDSNIRMLQAKGQVESSAAGSGTAGASLDGLIDDFHRQQDMFRQHNNQNLLYRQQQTGSANQGLQNAAAARIAGIQPYIPSPVSPVDYVGPALSVVGTGIQGYNVRQAARGSVSSSSARGYDPVFDSR